MFDTSVLNVFIGLILIFLLYSLLATALQEALSAVLQRRANTLYKGIKTMLTDTEPEGSLLYKLVVPLAKLLEKFDRWPISWIINDKEKGTLYERFYDHPIIKDYGENMIFNKPSYLTAQNFSTILIDTIKGLDKEKEYEAESFRLIRDNIYAYSKIPEKDRKETLKEPDAKGAIIDSETFKILNYHLQEAAGDLDVFRYRMERWFNDTMDRVSGWYKRSTQFWLFALGLMLSVAFNIDTLEITNYLSKNKEAAEKLADMATVTAGNPNYNGTIVISKEIYDTLKADLNKVNTLVGLGWGNYGLSDENFKRNIIDRKKKWSKEIEGFKDSAIQKYESQIKYLVNEFPKSDSTRKNNIQQQLSELIENRDREINQMQLSLFYESEGPSLKRKYVFYQLQQHPGKWIGFFIAAMAISLGAPFWFDLLNKFVSLRTAVKTVDSSGSTTRNNSVDNNNIDG